MKFNSQESKSIIQKGDIKNNGITIDSSNIDFIVTILSTNLYSKPVESFLRETISNAWDSHVEAGVEQPVILEFGKDTEERYYCKIQDFGVGLSPERFDNIYRKIGSSTKRETNDQIGGFGIGRFSALSVTDVVYITSVYNEVEYKYMMYKDGNSISIDLIHEKDTTDTNGVSIFVYLPTGSLPKYSNAIENQLLYFENVYIINKTDSLAFEEVVKKYNNFKIKKYKNFYVNNYHLISYYSHQPVDIILGKVKYPLRIENLSKSYSSEFTSMPISLKFEVGDLDVTPNREEILYSSKSIKKIEEVLEKSIEEIKELYEDYFTRDFDNITDYVEFISKDKRLTLLEDGEQSLKVKLNIPDIGSIRLNGKSYDQEQFRYLWNRAHSIPLIENDYISYGGRISKSKRVHTLYSIKDDFSNIYFCDVRALKSISKSYIREEMDPAYFIRPSKKVSFYVKKAYRYLLKYNHHTGQHQIKDIIRLISKYALRNLSKMKTFDNSKVPNSYIEKKKKEAALRRALSKKDSINWSDNINLYVYRESARYTGAINTSVDSITYSLEELAKSHKIVIYGEKLKDDEKLSKLFMTLKRIRNKSHSILSTYMVAFVAPTRMKLLEDLDNCVYIDDFMDPFKYKEIRRIGTSVFIQKELPHIMEVSEIGNIKDISTRLDKVLKTLRDYVIRSGVRLDNPNYDTLHEEMYDICKENDFFDEEIRFLISTHRRELENSKVILKFKASSRFNNLIPEDTVNLVVDYLLARKFIRPDLEAVKKLKEETIFNLKSEENEDN